MAHNHRNYDQPSINKVQTMLPNCWRFKILFIAYKHDDLFKRIEDTDHLPL